MASNFKALTGILKNSLLSLTVESLSPEELEIIFLQKDNDTADVLKDRAIYAIQKGIALPEGSLRKDAAIIKYLTENELSDVYTDAAEQLINNKKAISGKELLTGYFANPGPKAKLTENPAIKMQLDYVLHKSDFQNLAGELRKELDTLKKGQDPRKIRELMMKLDTIDKTLSQNFSTVPASLNLADKVDNLRSEITVLLMRARIRLVEKNKSDRKTKPAEFAALMTAYKDALQKKTAFFQNRLQKILEVIPTLQNKIVVNISKLKNAELSKSIQLYLKFNNEVIKLDEGLQELFRSYARMPAGREKEILTGKILDQQRNMIDKISRLEQFTSVIVKASPVLLKDVKELMSFYEEFYYLQTVINQFKSFIQEDADDLSGILSQLSRRELMARSLFLYRADKISYRSIRSYLECSLAEADSAMLYLDSKPGVTASIYVLPEQITFYGMVEVEAENFGKNAVKLTFSGNTGFRADSIVGTEDVNSATRLKTKVSFIFVDFDDASKFILSGFKKFDLFNRLQQVKRLEQV